MESEKTTTREMLKLKELFMMKISLKLDGDSSRKLQSMVQQLLNQLLLHIILMDNLPLSTRLTTLTMVVSTKMMVQELSPDLMDLPEESLISIKSSSTSEPIQELLTPVVPQELSQALIAQLFKPQNI